MELGRSNVGEKQYSVKKSGCTNKSFLEDIRIVNTKHFSNE